MYQPSLVALARRTLSRGATPAATYALIARLGHQPLPVARAVCLALAIPLAETTRRLADCHDALLADPRPNSEADTGELLEALGVFDVPVSLTGCRPAWSLPGRGGRRWVPVLCGGVWESGPVLHDGPDHGTVAGPRWWAAYLARHCAVAGTEREVVAGWFGTDVAGADAVWEAALVVGLEARVPFGGGHAVLLYSCDLPTDWGTEYLVLHPGWGRVRGRLAAVGVRFPGSELRWGAGFVVAGADPPRWHARPGGARCA
ncbi:hypothetical protein [Kitasatospora sp. NPDC005856]|uniref:hypothetical protein n=1 Tax=Kitasatospora sp. NPDC005856 TaxID=3154566 RepID=UPI0033F3D63E